MLKWHCKLGGMYMNFKEFKKIYPFSANDKDFVLHFSGENIEFKDFIKESCKNAMSTKFMTNEGFPDKRIKRLHNDFLKNEQIIDNFYETCFNDIETMSNEELRLLIDKILKLCSSSGKICKNINEFITAPDNITPHNVALVIKWVLFTLFYFSDDWYNKITNKDLFDRFNNDMTIQQERESDKALKHFLKENSLLYFENVSFVSELTTDQYNELRGILIEKDMSKEDELFLSGPSLNQAFSKYEPNNNSLINILSNLIKGAQVKKINIFITDPSIVTAELARGEIRDSLEILRTNLFRLCCEQKCILQLVFIPSFDITHSIITPNYMLYRSTKIWTQEREFKGSTLLFRNSHQDDTEYTKNKSYLNKLIELASVIDPETDENPPDEIHSSLRKYIVDNGYDTTYIVLKKLYRSQLDAFANSTWLNNDNHEIEKNFIASDDISSTNHLYSAENLLNDNTQRVLLPYIQETGKMLSELIKQKEYDNRTGSGAIVIPSLDLGYPNNVQRLAGGFATGMLINWESSVPIVPIDATVNVCSSSVFKIKPSEHILENFIDYVTNTLPEKAHQNGYSLNFESGNHFLMIAKDQDNPDDYYLVLHSSAKELKNSYFGLYPVENNWYSSRVKIKKGENGRYLRYIKGDDTKHFIQLAHHMEGYNKEIHKWVAKEMNQGRNPGYELIKNHYYMPTDSSIAIGTFVEQPGETVPLFSNVNKPVYLFKIAKKGNWTYKLQGKGRCCLIPHGWGQKIESIASIIPDLEHKTLRLNDLQIKIDSKERLNLPDKSIREFSDGFDFINQGKKFIKGEIEKTLLPVHLYCSKEKH